MQSDALELNAAFEHLTKLHQRQQHLETLAHLTQGSSDEPALAMACKTLGVSVEANPSKSVTRALQAVRDAIVKAWEYLVRLIRKYLSNYRVRTERIQDEITKVERQIQEGERAGWLSGQRSGHLDNPHIARALITGNRVTFNDVEYGLGQVSDLTRQVERFLKLRLTNNRKLMKNASGLTVPALAAQLELYTLRLQWRAASDAVAQQVKPKPYNTVEASEGLCGNQTLVKLGYKPGTTLADQLAGAPTLPAMPWVNSPYGHALVLTDPKLDLYATGAAFMPILSVAQLKNLTAKVRSQVTELKHTSNIYDDVEDALAKHASELKRIDFEGLNPLTRQALRAYLDDGTRNDLNLGISLGKYFLTLVFQTLQWIKASINSYRG